MNRNDWAVAATLAAFAGAVAGGISAVSEVDYAALVGVAAMAGVFVVLAGGLLIRSRPRVIVGFPGSPAPLTRRAYDQEPVPRLLGYVARWVPRLLEYIARPFRHLGAVRSGRTAPAQAAPESR